MKKSRNHQNLWVASVLLEQIDKSKTLDEVEQTYLELAIELMRRQINKTLEEMK